MLPLVIVGGGVSGLSTAYYLSKLSKFTNKSIGKIIVLESSNRFGGWVNTVPNEKNGVLHEFGPRSLRKAGEAGENTLQLMAELELVDDVLVKSPKDPKVRNRYIATEDKLFTLPSSFKSMFFRQRPLSRSLIGHALHELRTPRLDLSKQSFEHLGDEKSVIDRNLQLLAESELEDISIHEFCKLRMGEDVAELLVDPMLRGITSGNARTLSIRSMFKDLYENERAAGSAIKGSWAKFRASTKDEKRKVEVKMRLLNQMALPLKLRNIGTGSVWSFREGMARLPRAMVERLASDPNIELRKCNRLTAFELDEQNQLNLTVAEEDGTQKREYQIKAGQVFSSLNANVLANLIPVDKQESDNLSLLKSTLNSIPSASVSTVNLEFATKDLLKHTPGFGFLIPSHVNSSILGVIFESSIFPELDRSNEITRLSVMAGGDWFDELCSSTGQVDESKLLERSLQVISKYLGINEEPSFTRINVLRNCIPQYRVGHYLKLKLLDKPISEQQLKLSLIGSSYSGISINDCIFNGKLQAENYLQTLPSSDP